MHLSIAALVLTLLAGPSPTGDVTTRSGSRAAVSSAGRLGPAVLPAGPSRYRRAAVTAARRQARVEDLADRSGWRWRDAGISLSIGYHPRACCHWGVYDRATRTVWIGPSAFASQNRLRHTVLHELGHAWQFTSGQARTLAFDMAPFGRTGAAAYEAGADCVAAAWGSPARFGHYWRCPPEAQELVTRRLAGDWR